MFAGNRDDRILVIAPHADDEVLGCGGLIAKATAQGCAVKVVIAAVGDTFFYHADRVVPAQTRIKESQDALASLGCHDFDVWFDDKESQLATVQMNELVTKVDNVLAQFDPTVVLIPYPSFHQDHQYLFQACMAGLRPSPNKQYRVIAMFEYPFIVWQHPKIHDVGEAYLPMTEDDVNLKVNALRCHESQLREGRHMISPESVRLWAEKRGMESGLQFAEKYHLLRTVWL